MKLNSIDRLIPFTCDLHIHSALSPCAEDKMIPELIMKKLHNLGIDIFSITDHNSVFNCRAFQTIAKDYDILFIPGIEIQTSEEIHLLAYFPDIQKLNNFYIDTVKLGLNTHINQPKRFGNQLIINSSGNIIGKEKYMLSLPLNLSIDELVKSIHNFNGIAVAAHLDRGFSIISQLGLIPPKLELDAVEISNIYEIESIKSKFLNKNNLNIISSSDSHYIHMMKKPKMKLWLNNLNIESCLNCIIGKGPGKITLSYKSETINKESGKSKFGENKHSSYKDWKNLYKR